jgi:hypothetical protein
VIGKHPEYTSWPQPENARELLGLDALAQLTMQIVCPHTDTSKHRTEYARNIGIEYCNLCGASRHYLEIYL